MAANVPTTPFYNDYRNSKIDEQFRRMTEAERKELMDAYTALSVATSVVGQSNLLTQKHKLYVESILLNARVKVEEQMHNGVVQEK